MNASSKFLNYLTILIGLAVVVMAYLFLDAADLLREENVAKQAELDKAIKELGDAEKKREKDNKSLMARKGGLTEDLKEHGEQVDQLKKEVPEKNSEISDLKREQQRIQNENDQKLEEIGKIEAEIAKLRESANLLRQDNPTARANVDQLEAGIREQNELTDQLEYELRDYKAETEHLRVHYASILKELAIDAVDPSWIVLDKIVTTKIQRLSMEAGMLVFPLGSYHGMRNEMRFYVGKKGRRICQVIIKEAHLSHSVAHIVPLIGNPSKLQESDTVEITGF